MKEFYVYDKIIIGDNMKNKFFMNIVIICYLLSFLILLCCFRVRLNTNIKLILLFMVCVLIYISGILLIKKLRYNKKILKVNLIIYFLIYTMTIFSLTLFDEIYGRQGFVIIEWDKDLLDMYLNQSFNIIPFNTIKLFAEGYIKGIVSFKNFSINIIGNFFAFMPYSVFLPLILKKINKYYKFLIIMIIIIVLIEILQFVTMSGSCDIDDLILNLLGSSIAYFVVKIKCINKFIQKLFLLQ